LVLLEDRHDGTADRDTGSVERVERAWLLARRRPVANLRAPRLKVLAVRARRDLLVHALPRQPDLEVVRLRRRESEVAGAQRDDAIVQAEALQHALGILAHRFELGVARLGRGQLDELDLVELMLADQAARILAVRAGLGAKARRV